MEKLQFPVVHKTGAGQNRYIKHLFEDQYGDNNTLYEKYLQLDKSQKILLIDNWDRFEDGEKKSILLNDINSNFEYVVFTVRNTSQGIIEAVKDKIIKDDNFCELHIKPFFAELRKELVRRVCMQSANCTSEDIEQVNKLIDILYRNNSKMFSLNPDFIVKYTNYCLQDPYHDYAKGEIVFSQVFEHELRNAIFMHTKKTNFDEIMIAFEKIAGFMYKNRKDVLSSSEFCSIINEYNTSYGVSIEAKTMLGVGITSKILKEEKNLSISFCNRNHLAYFIAKFLVRASQANPPDTVDIEYALKNICFGINSDIVLFISYLSSSSNIIMSIEKYAGELLSSWEEVSMDKKNISLLYHSTVGLNITAPSAKEQRNFDNHKENTEEGLYPENVVTAKGLFNYNDKEIDNYPNKLIRAFKYTEFLCKALPFFNSSLKLTQKKELIDAIFLYPRKIFYAIFHPFDEHIETICSDIVSFSKKNSYKNKNGNEYNKTDIKNIFVTLAQGYMLDIFDHFAEICTSSKTLDLLLKKDNTDITETLEHLLIIENSGDTDLLVNEISSICKSNESSELVSLSKLILHVHLLRNPNMEFKKRQKINDKFFGASKQKMSIPR